MGYASVDQCSSSLKESKAPEQRSLRRFLKVLATHISSALVFLRCFPRVFARWVQRSVKAYFSEPSEDNAWTQTHSFFVLMGGFMLYVDGEPYLTLRHDDILKLIREECIKVPTLTAEQIHDKSKGNAISKGLIMLQVAWFVMQLITRAIYHLETTQLEVGTLAFAVLNFLTYAVRWNKPLIVQCPHPVYWRSTKSKPEDHIVNLDERYEHPPHGIVSLLVLSIAELMGLPGTPASRKFRVPTFDGSIELEDSDKTVLQLAAWLMATIFGGIRCMAWFFAFPTYQEQVLWRMSAVAMTSIPLLFFLILLNIIPAVVTLICGLTFCILYITARAILLVLMFTTLRNLPPDAYKVVLWTSLVPHL
ncbi:hypothetical protein BD769DRAFT_181228 [Suillus cothurnatus]|nr:hypothetical protein BD769DRAFT_181228 [Suillus cothurnatus]